MDNTFAACLAFLSRFFLLLSTCVRSHRIPAQNMEKLTAEFERLQRRAKLLVKRGYAQAEIGFDVIGESTRSLFECPLCRAEYLTERFCDCDRPAAKARKVFRVYKHVLPYGETPKASGWEFVAVLAHMGEAGAILSVVPRATVAEGELKAYRGASPKCDHCNVNRRRGETFLLRSETTGEIKQVGRQCLGAFLGAGRSPELLAAGAELLVAASRLLGEAGDEEGGFGGGGGRSYTGLVEFLGWTHASIEKNGWVSRSAARDRDVESTASNVWRCGISPSPMLDRSERLSLTDTDLKAAEEAIVLVQATFEAKGEDNLSDYEANVLTVIRAGYVAPKADGIAASIMVCAKRIREEEIKRQEWARRLPSKHVGTVGERISRRAKLERTHSFATDYGTTTIHCFVVTEGEDAGAVLKWFASQEDLGDRIGTEFVVVGTVKSHGEYKGRPETSLSRCDVATDAELAERAEKVAKAKAEKQAAAKAKREAAKAAKAHVAKGERYVIVFENALTYELDEERCRAHVIGHLVRDFGTGASVVEQSIGKTEDGFPLCRVVLAYEEEKATDRLPYGVTQSVLGWQAVTA